jgi:hypothetical protein
MRRLVTAPGIEGGPFDADGMALFNLGDSATPEELAAEESRLIAEWHSFQYQRERVYPEITDQLDQLYWDKKNGTNHWEEGIDAVKAAHPKP